VICPRVIDASRILFRERSHISQHQELNMAVDMHTPRSSPIAAGDIAPDFTLKTVNREEWTLSEQVKKSEVVLCFYPLAFTEVCSVEMKCVNTEMAAWQAKGAQVVGVSCDSFASNKAWADKEGFKQTLLCDMHRQVCMAYGIYWPELNVSQRATIVIGQASDGRGKVKFVQARPPSKAMDWESILAQL
jgi:alkyl hydroperoxide reductase subunit AhpC